MSLHHIGKGFLTFVRQSVSNKCSCVAEMHFTLAVTMLICLAQYKQQKLAWAMTLWSIEIKEHHVNKIQRKNKYCEISYCVTSEMHSLKSHGSTTVRLQYKIQKLEKRLKSRFADSNLKVSQEMLNTLCITSRLNLCPFPKNHNGSVSGTPVILVGVVVDCTDHSSQWWMLLLLSLAQTSKINNQLTYILLQQFYE